MFVYSKDSKRKVFHNQQCSYAQRISFSRRRKVHLQDEAIKAGYTKCKCCGRIAEQYQHEKAEIESICNSNYLRVEFVGGEMYVITHISTWKIIMVSKCKIKLLHQNAYAKRHPAGSRTPLSKMLFHEQRKYGTSIASLIEYILQHEEWRVEERFKKQLTNSLHGQSTKKQKRELARTKKRNKRRQIRGVLDLIDQLAICNGDYSTGHVMNC